MVEEMLNNILEWCFKNTNILEAEEIGNMGKRFIHFASENGYAPVVAKLLTQGIEVNLKDKLQKTPLLVLINNH